LDDYGNALLFGWAGINWQRLRLYGVRGNSFVSISIGCTGCDAFSIISQLMQSNVSRHHSAFF
jgi:hypothetical protein